MDHNVLTECTDHNVLYQDISCKFLSNIDFKIILNIAAYLYLIITPSVLCVVLTEAEEAELNKLITYKPHRRKKIDAVVL